MTDTTLKKITVELGKRVEHWRGSIHTPHAVGLAVFETLSELQWVFEKALRKQHEAREKEQARKRLSKL